VGGGVGGLAAAIALGKQGMDCVLMDQATQLHKIGDGLTLWSNGVKALRYLGVEDEAMAKGSVIEKSVAISGRGRKLATFDLAAIGREAGAVSIGIQRAELQKILLSRLQPGSVKNGARCVSFAVRGDSVIIHMADGSTLNGDVLIGADGIRSAVRTQLLGNELPRYAGYTGWRGVASGDWLPPGTAITVMGRAQHGGLLPCGPNRVYWFLVQNAPQRATLDLSTVVGNLQGPLAQAIAATPPTDILRDDIVDRPPYLTWGKGPVTLLGDAAHPSTPNLGQGACQALEDAPVLADCLREKRPAEESLRVYEQRRMPRTAMVTNESWRMGRLLQTDNILGVVARELATGTPMGRRLLGKLIRQLLRG
jgi:2-polyprenyl-6-methoxyphenol hydroxylase-like FAD-dependent oxidoreductase